MQDDLVESLRERFRRVPSVTGTAPRFDPDAVPGDPGELFREWIEVAISSGEIEPLAITVSTVDSSGAPDSRVVMLKDVTAEGEVEFATTDESAKARQLAGDPRCAVSVYWPGVARAVRLRGAASMAPEEVSRADFLARHPESRAIVFAGRQSTRVEDLSAWARTLEDARRFVSENPEAVDPRWHVWRVRPDSFEFWQGSPNREHIRIAYARAGGGWSHVRLRP